MNLVAKPLGGVSWSGRDPDLSKMSLNTILQSHMDVFDFLCWTTVGMSRFDLLCERRRSSLYGGRDRNCWQMSHC
jgi:hypothetical protein